MAVQSADQSSPFIPAFAVGTGLSLAVAKGVPPKFLKTEMTGEQIKNLDSGDKFVTTGDLTKEQKESVETVKKFLNDKNKPNAKGTKETNTTDAPKTSSKTDKKVEQELKNTFTDGDEIEKEKLLDGDKPKDFKEKIKLYEDEVNQEQKAVDLKNNEYKMAQDSRARADARLSREAVIKNEKPKELSKATLDYMNAEEAKLAGKDGLTAKLAKAKKDLADAPADITKAEKVKLQKAVDKAQGEFDRVKLHTLKTEIIDPKAKATDPKLYKLEGAKAQYKLECEARKLKQIAEQKKGLLEEAQKKLAEAKDPSEATKKALTAKIDKAEAEYTKAQAHADEIKAVVTENAATGADRITLAQARKKAAKTAEGTARKAVGDQEKILEAKQFEHQSLKSKLELYESAGKEKGSKISRSAFKEKLTTKIQAESSSKFDKAIEGLKGHFEKVGPGWGKAIGVALIGGLIIGGIAHMMGGSKKAPEEAAPVVA